jgi:hypothetical protein
MKSAFFAAMMITERAFARALQRSCDARSRTQRNWDSSRETVCGGRSARA